MYIVYVFMYTPPSTCTSIRALHSYMYTPPKTCTYTRKRICILYWCASCVVFFVVLSKLKA